MAVDIGMKGADGQFSSHICHTGIRYSRTHIAPITSFLVISTLKKKEQYVNR